MEVFIKFDVGPRNVLDTSFFIIHRIVNMMKDVDGLSHQIGSLIHRYLIHAYHMRANDNVHRPFADWYDTFTTCSNPRRVTTSDINVVTKSSPLLPLLSIVYHSPINFNSTPISQSCSAVLPKSPIFRHIFLPEDIL